MKPASFVVGSVLFALAACRNPFAADQSTILGVSELTAPSTSAGNAPLDVTLTVELGGCLSFDRIQIQRYAGGATLTVWGTDASIGRKNVSCTADIRYEPHNVRFDPPFSGAFDITVNRGRVSPLTATVQIQ